MVKFMICIKNLFSLISLIFNVDFSRHQKSSAEFYTNFWVLQEFFSKPFQLWERTSWNTFVHVCNYSYSQFCLIKYSFQNTNQVLDVFTNNQLDNIKTVASSDEAFFAKYLTSEKVRNSLIIN